MNTKEGELPLEPYRALDLTNEVGFLCGKTLGDLGVDVIKIEPPGGDSGRRLGPFYRDIPDPEKSLYWFAYNANKRGITLNLDTLDGREILKKLVSTADFLIESFSPGQMSEWGFDYPSLKNINPGIIMVSISHFGQEGPYKDYKGCDLVDIAASGYMYLCGDRDRPPVRISAPQAYLNAGLEACVGAMIAFYERQTSGEGQLVDVSVQQSMVRIGYASRIMWDMNQQFIHRSGNMTQRQGRLGSTLRPQTWSCKDGAIAFLMIGGMHGVATNIALVKWMQEEGMADDYILGIDWAKEDVEKETQDEIDAITERLSKFFMSHTAAELYEGAKKRRILLYPKSSPQDIAENPQLAARGFWEAVEHPELNDTITYPGAFLKSSASAMHIRRRPPLIGEHNQEIFGEMGLTGEQIITLKQSGVI